MVLTNHLAQGVAIWLASRRGTAPSLVLALSPLEEEEEEGKEEGEEEEEEKDQKEKKGRISLDSFEWSSHAVGACFRLRPFVVISLHVVFGRDL